jgi:serine/threonine protein kinase
MKLNEKNKLGQGAYGSVYKIKTKDKKTICAAKIFKVPFKLISNSEKVGYDRELQIIQETSHPFVIKYLEEFLYKDKLCIVT